MAPTTITTTCCIAGGGPAGMMLGFLLARAGVKVAILEKHADFLRDFRGDTIHPSTLELMHELGLLDAFLKLPHSRVTQLSGQVGAATIHLADFSHLPTHCKFIALMPQWDFLDFLAAHGKQYPAFDLRMRTEATDLIEEGGRVAGVRATSPDGELEIRLDDCDGPVVAKLPLAPAKGNSGVTTLTGSIAPQQGTHTLCATFTQNQLEPVWVLDKLTLSGPQ